MPKFKTLFEDKHIKITQYSDSVHIEDLEAPYLADAVLILSKKSFWKMIKKCGDQKNED